MANPKLKTVEVELTPSLSKRISKIARLMGCSDDEVITGFLDTFVDGKLTPDSFVSQVRKKRQKSKTAK